MKNYSTKTDLITLSEVMKILDECELMFLITGKQEEEDLNVSKIVQKLFVDGKLIELLTIITGEKPEKLHNLEISDALEVVVDFFVNIGKTFSGSIAKITQTIPQEKP